MRRCSRRSVLVAGIALVSLTACRRESVLIDPAEPVPPLPDRIALLERRHNAYVGLYGLNPASGREVMHRGGDPFALCSTFKTYAAARVLQMTGAGELNLDDPVSIDSAAVVAHSPITGPKAGGSLTLGELCQAALAFSDNTAGNQLLKTIGGPPAVTRFARSIGDEATRLDRWEPDLNSAIPGDLRDTSTPRTLGRGYRNLLLGNVLGEPQRAQLEMWMRGSATSARSMRAGLPPGWTAADKTGGGDFGSTNDVGVAFGPDGQQLVLSIMTRSRADDPDAPLLQPLIAEATTLVLPYLR